MKNSNSTFFAWSIAALGAAAFVVGAMAPAGLQAMADGTSAGATAVSAQRGGGAGGGGGQGGGQAPGRGGAVVLRAYAEVITGAGLKTESGIFKVHRITEGNNDNLFYEIPVSQLNKDFLWNTQLKKTTIGSGYGGQAVGTRVVRWQLKRGKCFSSTWTTARSRIRRTCSWTKPISRRSFQAFRSRPIRMTTRTAIP
jgi:hypothetical protein